MVENGDKKEKAFVNFCSSHFLFFEEKSDSQKYLLCNIMKE